jgi:hypothetical protein
LGNSKKGVFTADFEEINGTTVEVRDGTAAMLNCRVYLRHDKTVGQKLNPSIQIYQWKSYMGRSIASVGPIQI